MAALTENEAKLRWCPFAVASHWNAPGGGNRLMRNDVPSNVSVVAAACHCIASECMAWRWQAERDALTRDIPRHPNDVGFCGLAREAGMNAPVIRICPAVQRLDSAQTARTHALTPPKREIPLSAAARAARDMIGCLVAKYDNEWTELRLAAMHSAELGLPAYWSKATYSQSTQRVFALSANKDGIIAALRTWADDRHPHKTPDALLASLIPLNTVGVLQKEFAWWNAAPGARP